MQKRDNNSHHPPLLPAFIQTFAAVTLLGAFWFLITLLPYFEELSLPLPFNLSELLSAILFTVIVILLLIFGVKLERSLYSRLTRFKTTGSMIKLLMVIGSVIILYIIYQPIILPYTGEMGWAYHVFFLFLLIGLSGIFIYSAYKMLGSASPGAGLARENAALAGTLGCNGCGSLSPPGMDYCGICGERLINSEL